MLGRDVIKAILDKDMANEEIQIIGITEEGIAIDTSINAPIAEITNIEMEDGEPVASIVVNAILAV